MNLIEALRVYTSFGDLICFQGHWGIWRIPTLPPLLFGIQVVGGFVVFAMAYWDKLDFNHYEKWVGWEKEGICKTDIVFLFVLRGRELLLT